MATSQQKSNIISAARQSMTDLLDASARIKIIRERADDLGLLIAGPDILTDPDFLGDNVGINAAAFIAALSTADTAVSQANRRTIAKVRH